jgi:peptide/nickel transport system substrate-binding protein
MNFSRFVSFALVSLLFFAGPFARAETIRFGISELPPALGNPYTAMGLPSGSFFGSLYDALTVISKDGELRPSLAQKWEQTAPNRWLFTLRKDIKFHNGAPFDARSVVTSIEYLKSPDAARYLLAAETKNISRVSSLSDHEVEFITIEPDAILPRRLSPIMMIEPQLWAQLGPVDYAKAPVGTGPYAFVEWGRGAGSATLKSATTGWRKVKDVDALEYVEVPNAVAREQGLLSGGLDIIDSLNPDSVSDFRKAGFNTQAHARSQILSLALPNVGRPKSPLNSASVRQALNIAVDREGIAKHIFGGSVEAASQGAVEGTVGFNPKLTPYPYDPVLARRMIADAGYKNGFPLTMAVLQVEGSAGMLAYQKLSQDLVAVGVQAEIKTVTAAEFLRRFVGNEWGEYDAFSLLWNNEPMLDVGRSIEYFSCLRPHAFFCDESVTDEIRSSRSESDPEKRELLLQEIMARMKDIAPAIWLTNLVVVTASRPGLENIEVGTSGLAFENIIFRQ